MEQGAPSFERASASGATGTAGGAAEGGTGPRSSGATSKGEATAFGPIADRSGGRPCSAMMLSSRHKSLG